MGYRSRLKLAGSRCPYCHAPVSGAPEKCPGCGLALDGVQSDDFGLDGKRNPDGRRRLILVIGAVALFGTGLAVRHLQLGFLESDPGPVARRASRKDLTQAMDLVLARKFDDAAETLEPLLERDELFAEAYLVRCLARLGQGRYLDTVTDAARAERFIKEGKIDPKAKGVAETGPALARRSACFATAAEESALPVSAGPALFDHLVGFGKKATCAEMTEWVAVAPVEVRATVTRALATCRPLFPCTP